MRRMLSRQKAATAAKAGAGFKHPGDVEQPLLDARRVARKTCAGRTEDGTRGHAAGSTSESYLTEQFRPLAPLRGRQRSALCGIPSRRAVPRSPRFH